MVDISTHPVYTVYINIYSIYTIHIICTGGYNMQSLFSCNNITKTFDNFTLSDISFELPHGMILGLIGRNGSGKSTLIRTLAGSYYKSSGDSFANGFSLHNNMSEYKSHIAYISCHTPFHLTRSSLANALIYSPHYKSFDMNKYTELLTQFNVCPKSTLTRLSTGQQIKQQLAFALSYDASVYIFDEPTGNLDVEFRDEFYEIIRKLVSNDDKCVIYSTHLVEELEEFADYILWLKRNDNESKAFFYGTIDELKDNYMKHFNRYATLKEIMYYEEKEAH